MRSKLLLSFLLAVGSLFAKPCVEGQIIGQLGNNLFIVAATQALAWDNDADAYFPGLQYNLAGGQKNLVGALEHIFFRCNLSAPPSPMKLVWREPSLAYHKIPFHDGLRVFGYVQSEKYFAHHRQKILDLFAPHPDDLKYIQTKYKWLLDHPNTVSIQLRKYFEDPNGNVFLQYGKDFVRQAMKQFPNDALFLAFGNDKEFVKNNIPEEMLSRVKFMEGEPHYIDLHLISMCKHNIICNSSFGWWGAWLNQNPNKKVIAPKQYYNPNAGGGRTTVDYFPESWITIDAKGGPLNQPQTYQ